MSIPVCGYGLRHLDMDFFPLPFVIVVVVVVFVVVFVFLVGRVPVRHLPE